MRLRILILTIAVVAGACSADANSVREAESSAPSSPPIHGELPIDQGEVQLTRALCEAARLLVAADTASIERSQGDFDLNDAAVTEWEFRLYGLRYAAQTDPTVPVADSAVIQQTTLALGRIDGRTGYINYLPPTADLVTAAQDLRAVMLRLCPTEWAAEVVTRVISEG